jgi:hypothetical protein
MAINAKNLLNFWIIHTPGFFTIAVKSSLSSLVIAASFDSNDYVLKLDRKEISNLIMLGTTLFWIVLCKGPVCKNFHLRGIRTFCFRSEWGGTEPRC